MDDKQEKIREFQQLPIFEKLQKIANKLNGNEKIDFNKYQCRNYLAYDYNSKFITQLSSGSPFKIAGVVYCLNANFRDVAIKWIGKDELEKYLKG